MRESYGGSGENKRGFHHREDQGHDHNTGSQGRIEPPAAARAGMKEPTNHAGHTHEMARRHEHDARVEAHRGVHAGKGQQDHEKILHDSHKLHQGSFTSHGNKYGESHHIRKGDGE
jgi:hypothetical protein